MSPRSQIQNKKIRTESTDKILSAAFNLMSKNGYDSTSISQIAKEAGMSPVTLATAWSMNFDFVASTIVGARTADQLEESLAALDVTLDDETLKQCDDVHKQILYPMG